MELTSLQKSTAESIINLYDPEHKKICEFKSPTGSGKTLMASYFISEMIERFPDEKFVFVIATPSSSSLPLFFERKINAYKADLPFPDFEAEYIRSPSTAQKDHTEAVPVIIPQQNKVYIFGKSSFGKNRILSEYGIIDDFVLQTASDGYRLIYIRDEAHIGGETADNGQSARNFEHLMSSNAAFVLKMTATPDNMAPTEKIELKESELNNPVLNDGKWLLKTTPVSLLDSNMEDTKILEDAVQKFKIIKEEYAKLNKGINPAMLIQIDNDSQTDATRRAAFAAALQKIKKTLNAEGLSWVQYFGDDEKDSNRVYKGNFTLEDISANNNDIDAVLFKIGPSVGWDIPRACMLLQLRRVSSASLNIQTLGRIKRNPFPGLQKNPVTDKYYVYSNQDNATERDVRQYVFNVQQKFGKEVFLGVDIVNKKEMKSSESLAKFTKLFAEKLHAAQNTVLAEINKSFKDGKYYKTISVSGGHTIYSVTDNSFIFLRDYKRLVNNNSFIYDAVKGPSAKFCKNCKVQEQFLITVLLTEFRKKIFDLLSAAKSCPPEYKISERKYDPQSYTEIYSSDMKRERVSKRNYLFEINKNDPLLHGEQPLDSSPEETVFRAIYDFADEYDGIRLWAKNQTTSNIFGEYLDDSLNIRRSFFDFIIKFDNGCCLYLEVKGEHDINAAKTELLRKAYADYFKGGEDLFKHKFIIAVCKVDERCNINFADSIFYDKTVIKENLGVLPFQDLLKKIAEF